MVFWLSGAEWRDVLGRTDRKAENTELCLQIDLGSSHARMVFPQLLTAKLHRPAKLRSPVRGHKRKSATGVIRFCCLRTERTRIRPIISPAEDTGSYQQPPTPGLGYVPLPTIARAFTEAKIRDDVALYASNMPAERLRWLPPWGMTDRQPLLESSGMRKL